MPKSKRKPKNLRNYEIMDGIFNIISNQERKYTFAESVFLGKHWEEMVALFDEFMLRGCRDKKKLGIPLSAREKHVLGEASIEDVIVLKQSQNIPLNKEEREYVEARQKAVRSQ